MKYKILAHIGQDQNEYKSFLHNLLSAETEDFMSVATNLHNNLFDIYYANKPDILLTCASEYSQEMHDFISEFRGSVRVGIFLNMPVTNNPLLSFWKEGGVFCIGPRDRVDKEILDKHYLYHRLYDNKIFKPQNNERNDKIAVLLSSDDNKNNSILSDLLYPASNEKLVLFNSITYKHPQNVGLLLPPDINLVFNAYNQLLDLDNLYTIEAQICGINNILIDDSLLSNIRTNKVRENFIFDPVESSYEYFINHTLLPQLKETT